MSEQIQEINGQEFPAILEGEEPVLVDFWAPWCGPCRMLAPVLEELAAQWAGQIRVVKLNVDENRELAGQFRIMSVPTLLVFKGGKEVTRLTGYMPREELEEKVGQVL